MELFEKSRREDEFGWGPSSAQGRVTAYKTPKAFDISKTRRANLQHRGVCLQETGVLRRKTC